MAHCRDVMHTSNPCKDYVFSWTVENFHLLPTKVVRGPAFSPIPGCLKKFCFELELGYLGNSNKGSLIFRMIDFNPSGRNNQLNVYGKVTLRNGEELLCPFVSVKVSCLGIQPITLLYAFDKYSFRNRNLIGNVSLISSDLESFGLADGKIILKGTLKFSGYSIKSSMYSLCDRNCEEVTQNLKTIFDSGIGSDVTFTVGSQILRAHKAILVARSEVFANMFQHDMLVSETNNVIINDVDYGTFNRFLVYLYTGVLELTEDRCIAMLNSLYSVALKYQVMSLRKICVSRLTSKLTVESACADLMMADLHGDEEFKRIVKIFLRKNIFSVVCTQKWTEIVATKPALAREVMDFVEPSINNQ